MHQALYRKWRPHTFDDVCGQEHITSILKYQTQNDRFSHAYLFCGSRGTGKTTCAKILAKAVNCESPIDGSPCNGCASCLSIDSGAATDVLEMDAASNNGVDNIRDIRDEVVYMPSALKYRVYIVDEVHMLSGSAFNALLKTLEEPPAHVIFVLATTELHKLPATIVSRCQRFDFRRINTEVLMSRLAYIAENEGIEYERDALRVIAKQAQGGMRDAISLLELCAGTQNKITLSSVSDTLGTGSRESLENTVRAIAAGNFDAIFAALEEVSRSAKDISVFWQELLSYYRDMLVMKTTVSAAKYLDLTDSESERLARSCELFTKETLLMHCKILDEALLNMKMAGAGKRIAAEMALIKMSDGMLDTSTDAILSRISRIEAALASGVQAPKMQMSEKKPKAVQTEKKPEAPQTEKAQTAVAEKTLKPLRGWNEIAENASADAAVLPFLTMARAFTDGEKIYVKFPNDFAKSMADSAGAFDGVRTALAAATGRQLAENDVVWCVLEGNEDAAELDDLEV